MTDVSNFAVFTAGKRQLTRYSGTSPIDDDPTSSQLAQMGREGHRFYTFYRHLHDMTLASHLSKNSPLVSRAGESQATPRIPEHVHTAADPAHRTPTPTAMVNPRSQRPPPSSLLPSHLHQPARGAPRKAQESVDTSLPDGRISPASPTDRERRPKSPPPPPPPASPPSEQIASKARLQSMYTRDTDETYAWLLIGAFLDAVLQLATVYEWCTLRQEGDEVHRYTFIYQ